MNIVDAWNAPDNMWCFSGEPTILNEKVYLGCIDNQGALMGEWSKEGFNVLSRAKEDHLFSVAVAAYNKVSWYEYNEAMVERGFEYTDTLSVRSLRSLGPFTSGTDTFAPFTNDSLFFRSKTGQPSLYVLKDDSFKLLFNPGASYLFSPSSGPKGEIALKVRFNNFAESSPDQLWFYFNNEWKMILEDQDSNPASPWKSFRNQVTIYEGKVLAIASDGKNDSLLLIENSKVTVIAKTGTHLARFDHFSPKMNKDTIVVRGEDFENRKAVFVKDDESFRPLLVQGNIVHTDRGLARVDYKDRDALFYGAPGIDEKGNIVIQGTLTDADFPSTLLGIGLIRFNKE